jgi:hypothetical protein
MLAAPIASASGHVLVKKNDNWQVKAVVLEESCVTVPIFLPQITRGLCCFCSFYDFINF